MVTVIEGGTLGKPRGSLDDLKGCKREVARVYRSAANGRISWADATKAVYTLTALANFIIAADLEGQLGTANNRPAAVQQQLLRARQDKDDIDARLKLQAPADQLPWLTEAQLWSRTTRAAALRSEIGMLDQELLSMPMRINLLEAQRDQASRTVKRIAARVKILEELSSRQGNVEAEQAREEAAEALSDAVGKHD